MKRAGIFVGLFLILSTIVVAQPRITDLRLSPDPVDAGEYLTISYTLTDDARLRRVVTDIDLPGAINHKQVDTVPQNVYAFSEDFRIPLDFSNGTYEVQMVVTPDRRPNMLPQYRVEVRPLAVVGGAEEVERYREEFAEDDVFVRVEPIRNIPRGSTVLFPVRLVNTHDEEKTVLLGMEGVTWGTYGVLPEQEITVPARRSVTAYFQAVVDADAPTGLQPFAVTSELDGEIEREETAIAILSETAERKGFPWLPFTVLLMVLLALLLIAVAWYRRKEEEDEDLITYY